MSRRSLIDIDSTFAKHEITLAFLCYCTQRNTLSALNANTYGALFELVEGERAPERLQGQRTTGLSKIFVQFA